VRKRIGSAAFFEKPLFPFSDFLAQEKSLMNIVFSLAVLAILAGRFYRKDIVDELFVTLLFIAASPWLIPYFMKTFGLKTAEVFGLKIERLEDKLKEESRRLDQLFLLSLGDHAFEHIEKLGSAEGFGPFIVQPPFERELIYLENLGYIRYKKPLEGFDDFRNIKKGSRLDDYIELTDSGKLYLALRSARENNQ
jgi:hypothetical protein